MSSQKNLAAPESNERRGENPLTHEQKADLLHYIAPLTRLLELFEGGYFSRVIRRRNHAAH
ncbi:hypothetical protein AB7W40_22510 [Providencia rettgeri]